MNLKAYYQSFPEPVAPKTEFIRKIARICDVGEPTVRLWVAGTTKPSNQEHVVILSRESGIPVNELFV